MKFDVGVPSGAIKHYETWVGDGQLHDFAVAAERAGLDAVNVTDHPFPDDEWLSHGGHHAFDPFVALSSMAAVTTTIGLRTNLLVAGYRNPYMTARSVASLDVLSGGRVIVGMGAGYLRSEFEVLGADFGQRGKMFDETIEAMTAAFGGRRSPGRGASSRPWVTPCCLGPCSGPARRSGSAVTARRPCGGRRSWLTAGCPSTAGDDGGHHG